MKKTVCFLLFTLLLIGCQSKVSKGKPASDYVSESDMAPHTALVRAEILSVSENVFEMKVHSVIKYGANTPSVKKSKMLKLRKPEKSDIKSGEKIVVLLDSELVEIEGRDKTVWGLIKIVRRGEN